MRYLCRLVLSGFSIILLISIIIPFIYADTIHDTDKSDSTKELNQTLLDNSSSQGNFQYSATKNFNSEAYNASISLKTLNNSSMPVINNSSNSTLQNESLAEIIKSGDWKALSEYKCRIKAENPNAFDNSEISQADKEAKWNGYFTPPTPPVSFSCCG